MHILPTRGRPKGLQRFFDEGKPEQPGVVVIEKDQRALYAGVRFPQGWNLLVREEREGYVHAANAAFDAFPNEPWYGMVSDDSVGRTPHWDSLLAAAAVPNRLVWPNDLYRGRCTFPCIGGELCRAAGWFVYPLLWHSYCDTVWFDLQQKLGIAGGYMEDVVLEHMHYVVHKAAYDQTYAGRIPRYKRGFQLGKSPPDFDRCTYAEVDWDRLAKKLRCAL